MAANRLLGGRYQLGEILGFGGMSEVYAAEDQMLGRQVAVKVLRADLARDDVFQQRFEKEAQHAAGLNHPAIVSILDTGEMPFSSPTGGSDLVLPYIVMELVEGDTLREALRRQGHFPQRKAAGIIAEVLGALEVAHEAGLVHRDIKPGNIMLTSTGAVKVVDFGIARLVTELTNAMTTPSMTVGTAHYFSPEQARGKHVDARSDLYSAGCVLYELLTGTPPFTGDTMIAVAYQHLNEEHTPPSEVVEHISPGMDAVLTTALAKDPEHRYQTAAEMRQDLMAILDARVPTIARSRQAEIAAAAATVSAPVVEGGAPEAQRVMDAKVLPDESAEPPRRSFLPRRLTTRIIAMLAAAVLLVAIGIGALLVNDQGMSMSRVTITAYGPNQSAREVESLLRNQGLQVEVDTQFDPTRAEGTVISLDPPSGTSVRTGSTVLMVVSSGAEMVPVPDLANLTLEQATAALSAVRLSLDPGHEEQASDDVPKDGIIRQSPQAGNRVPVDSQVRVVISTGPEERRVPNVIGQTESAARESLLTAGFQVNVDYVDDVAASGTVLASSHSGQDAPPETIVTLQVSNGALFEMPSLMGMTPDVAYNSLRAAGWEGQRGQLIESPQATNDLNDQGRIIGQTPQGAQLSKRADVSVQVGQFQLLPVPPG